MSDECHPCETPVVMDLPATLVRLAEIEALVMRMARDVSRGPDAQLMALQIAHRLLLNRVQVIEMRDVQQAQRALERRLSLDHAEREPWE